MFDATMLESLLSIVAAAMGFAAGKLWEQYTDKRKQIELELWKVRVGALEKKLREFLWPLYFRLQRDNVVWEKILGRDSQDPEIRRVAQQIERDIILPNHSEIVKIIESGMHFVTHDEALENALLSYMRHIDVYRSIRAAEIYDKDPVQFGEPYPNGVFELIDQRVHELQEQYDRVVAERARG